MPVGGKFHRLAAFSLRPGGGNPAGIWVGDALPTAAEMQRIAAGVGFSETAFVTPATGRARTIRYFSPESEVSFCGHVHHVHPRIPNDYLQACHEAPPELQEVPPLTFKGSFRSVRCHLWCENRRESVSFADAAALPLFHTGKGTRPRHRRFFSIQTSR